MYKSLLYKLVIGEKPNRDDIENELYEMCDREHSSCNECCLVYAMNNNSIPNTLNTRAGCDCFKDGEAMFNFIKERSK